MNSNLSKSSLQKLLHPYVNSEFLPINIISKLLECSFVSSELLHEYSEYHKIIKIKIDDLLSASITNWQYNRPADLIRCRDIAKYIYRSKKYIDTMLYLSFNNKTKSFDVIDGIHRYTSLKILQYENSKPIDLLTPSEFGGDNDATWLYESYIIVNIRINSSDGELIELFKTLNKSNPIPDLYIRDVNKDKREIIETLCNNWQIKYKSHFSSKNKPNKPNINRDRFIDFLEILYDKYNISDETRNKLEDILDKANTMISYNIPPNITESIKEKCNKSGLWIFMYSIEELMRII